MHAENPLREIVQRFKPMSTRSRVYAVSFDGTILPNGRPAHLVSDPTPIAELCG